MLSINACLPLVLELALVTKHVVIITLLAGLNDSPPKRLQKFVEKIPFLQGPTNAVMNISN